MILNKIKNENNILLNTNIDDNINDKDNNKNMHLFIIK